MKTRKTRKKNEGTYYATYAITNLMDLDIFFGSYLEFRYLQTSYQIKSQFDIVSSMSTSSKS